MTIRLLRFPYDRYTRPRRVHDATVRSTFRSGRVARLVVSILWGLILAFPKAVESSQVELPPRGAEEQITLAADLVRRWQEPDTGRELLVLQGNCRLTQGPRTFRSGELVVWVRHAATDRLAPHELQCYFEGAVAIEEVEGGVGGPKRVLAKASHWSGVVRTLQPLRYRFALPAYEAAAQRPEIVHRAHALFATPTAANAIRDAGFTAFEDETARVTPAQFVPEIFAPPQLPASAAPSQKRVRVFPRAAGAVPNGRSFLSPDGRQQITVIDSGVNIIIEGLSQLGVVDIATDRAVIWSRPLNSLGNDAAGLDGLEGALEIYLEGNIVFRQADRIIYAESMYYNVPQESGIVMNAELLAGVPGYPGAVRLKADILRQVDRQRFQANQAAITTSRLGVPRYWFQAGDLRFEDRASPVIHPVTGQPVVDPLTGAPLARGERLASSRNNVIYLGEIPVFYWPSLQTDLTQPSTLIRRIRIGNDRVFGTQIGVGIDLNRLTGWLPNGVDWIGSIDYLSDRGVGLGTTLDYVLPEFFGLAGETRGYLDAWGIDDDGLDNLGADRRALTPEESFRGRVLWQHRQRADNGLQMTGEVGLISDRNFLEQYYEREWDQGKDQSTGAELKYLTEHGSWNLSAQLRINDFFTQTEWLPRLDHFELGRPLVQDRLTWFGHNHLGYARLETATAPVDPADAASFNPLAWEANRDGIRAGARHELNLPLRWGPSRFVPFVSGEVMHWGADLFNQERTRLFGQAGVQWSLPMVAVDRTVRDELLQLNGLAHKVVFDAEFLWADSSVNLGDLPLYDPLDDDAQEHFRRRFIDSSFGGLPFVADGVPLRFDERTYAFRSGMQRWVTAPSAEIADDLMRLQMGVRQRWQTKRGLPGRERIIDWMTFDIEGSLFPRASRDNFGEDVGLLQYDWRWHLGDRFTLMSDGYADTFADGLKTASIGGYMSRPERGSLYLGFRSIEGPISSNVITAAVNYRMSAKWIAAVGAAIDLGPTGNIGQSFELTRIGESFLVSVGANIDESRNNVGFGISVEPRFLPSSYRARLGGVPLLPAGADGLE